MNEELYLLFCEMNPESRIAVDHAFKRSPKMLRLVNFLKTANASFKTPKVINIIYKEEVGDIDYTKLINRFYKLRQQLIEWLYHYLKKTEDFSSKEEQSLNFIRYLTNKNQFKDALEKAIKLEKHCKKLNLLELLPGILNLIIYCRQCMVSDDFKLMDEDQKRLLEAIEWHNVLQKAQYYHQASYKTRTIEGYNEMLKTIRKVVVPYKKIPRFALIYHYAAFSKGIPLLGKMKSTNALVRHLNKIEAILGEHPQMPIVFLMANYAQFTKCKLLLLKAMFYFQQGNYKQAIQFLRDQDRLVAANPNLSFPISEAELHNILAMFVAGKQYDAALKKWEEIVAFHKKHEQDDRLGFDIVEKVNILFFRFPQGNLREYQDFWNEVVEVKLDKQYASYWNVAIIWMKLLLGKTIDRAKLLKEKNIFEQVGLDIELMYRMSIVITTKDEAEKKRVVQELNNTINEKVNSTTTLYYTQFIRIINHHFK